MKIPIEFGDKTKIPFDPKKLKAAIILILMLTAIVPSIDSIAKAQTNQVSGASQSLPSGVTPGLTFDTVTYISFRPNPIGLGQPLLVNLWMEPPINVARWFKDGYQVTLTKPDGTKVVIGPLTSFQGDTTAWFDYTVDQMGTWQIRSDFLGGYFPAGNSTPTENGKTIDAPKSVYYKPSHDGPYNFTVQQDVVASWPGSPLPTDYWTRPVSITNREWWPMLGSYPSTGIVGGGPYWPAGTNKYMSNYKFVPYVQGPNTCHVVWKQLTAISGLIGGTLGQNSLSGYGSVPTIIYAGRCYTTLTKAINGVTQTVWECYDLRTGEIYWDKTDVGSQIPTMVNYITRTGSAVAGEAADARGLDAYLLYVGGGRVIDFNPYDGTVFFNVSISPLTTGTFYANTANYPVFYTVQTLGSGTSTNYRLINFNITGDAGVNDITNKRLGIISNISWPFSSLGTVDFESAISVNTAGINDASAGVTQSYVITAASMTTGQVLWNITTSEPFGGLFSGSTAIADYGKFAVRLNDGHWHCWDLQTGAALWVSELSSWPWGIWGIYGTSSAYGLLIYPQYDGVVAYNWTTGKVAWRYSYYATFPYETVYEDGYYPFYDSVMLIADGKVYTSNTEHTASEPATRGWALHCINATNGEGIWHIDGSMGAAAIEDGYLVAGNRYDGYMYVFGKGKTATTVTAPDTVTTQGNGIVIKGTVLDISPAQQGTPCVSKDSMTTQMQYLHMQEPIDGVSHNETITGVPVKLTAISSDGSVIDLGTVTTNGYYGTFMKSWVPPTTGDYQIIASFAGDDSYGSSSTSTGISISAAATTPTLTTNTLTASDVAEPLLTYLIVAVIAIIIAIAIVGALILRKRP